MRKILLASILILTLCECKKYPNDGNLYYPKVKILDAVIQSNGSVLVRGEITSNGSDPVEYAGFCMDTTDMPAMISNQHLISRPDSAIFTTTYVNLNTLNKYYFRSFAVNANGYSISEQSITVSNISIDTNSIACHGPINQINLEGSMGVLSEPVYVNKLPDSSPWEITASSNSLPIIIEFGKKPVNGIYHISGDTSPGPSQVSISTGSFNVNSGTDVQVVQINESVIGVWVCNAKVYHNGELCTLKLHLRTQS